MCRNTNMHCRIQQKLIDVHEENFVVLGGRSITILWMTLVRVHACAVVSTGMQRRTRCRRSTPNV